MIVVCACWHIPFVWEHICSAALVLHASFDKAFSKMRVDSTDKAKKINAMSQSSWQIGIPDLNAFFFKHFFFFFLSSRRVRFESVTALKYGTWFLDEQDTRQNTELKKSVVRSVSLCLSYLFLYILTRKFIKNWEKKLRKQKNFKPWSLLNQTRTEK